ncbi:hypothetical protein Asulf_01922 [Archaeoglobus sulfaticallidus PM70-1]|uniref:Uncharacterized protein n=1 Tax=Archaeoglobus sulfaticallidus PM70-1 TaxID=387631 RepID=N0BFT6_9EURY|nr:hypothetical protein Asulf_01922 [Archaeoglobus sulfaticallidus PM70-1]
MSREFDVIIAFALFHFGIFSTIFLIAISIFFLTYPYNLIVSTIGITAGLVLIYKGIKLGKSLKSS